MMGESQQLTRGLAEDDVAASENVLSGLEAK